MDDWWTARGDGHRKDRPNRRKHAHIYFRAFCHLVTDMYSRYLRAGWCRRGPTGTATERAVGCAWQMVREREDNDQKMIRQMNEEHD